MAKKTVTVEQVEEVQEVEQVFDLPIEPTPVYTHPIQDKVLQFRAQGYDNNRIASLLGIQKSVVDGIV